MMVAGGAEELCPTEAAVFDTLYATSTMNDEPQRSPRPFDVDRDGLVIGEGACSLILENRDHALARLPGGEVAPDRVPLPGDAIEELAALLAALLEHRAQVERVLVDAMAALQSFLPLYHSQKN